MTEPSITDEGWYISGTVVHDGVTYSHGVKLRTGSPDERAAALEAIKTWAREVRRAVEKTESWKEPRDADGYRKPE